MSLTGCLTAVVTDTVIAFVEHCAAPGSRQLDTGDAGLVDSALHGLFIGNAGQRAAYAQLIGDLGPGGFTTRESDLCSPMRRPWQLRKEVESISGQKGRGCWPVWGDLSRPDECLSVCPMSGGSRPA